MHCPILLPQAVYLQATVHVFCVLAHTRVAGMLSPKESTLDELPRIKKGEPGFDIDTDTLPSFELVLAHQWQTQQRRTLYSRRQYAEIVSAQRYEEGSLSIRLTKEFSR